MLKSRRERTGKSSDVRQFGSFQAAGNWLDGEGWTYDVGLTKALGKMSYSKNGQVCVLLPLKPEATVEEACLGWILPLSSAGPKAGKGDCLELGIAAGARSCKIFFPAQWNRIRENTVKAGLARPKMKGAPR